MAESKGPKFGEWTPVTEAMPEIPEDSQRALVIAVTGGRVKGMAFARNDYARSERGRAPRWEEQDGRLAWFPVTHWMPYPDPPESQP